MSQRFSIGLILVGWCLTTPGFSQPDEEEVKCLSCHGVPGLEKKLETGQTISYSINAEKWKASVHGNLKCTDCHHGEWSYPHVNITMAVDCGICHSSQKEVYVNGIHGIEASKRNPDVPTCKTCHGVHYIQRVTVTDPQKQAEILDYLMINMCSQCHGNPALMGKYQLPRDRYFTYKDSFHGRTGSYGEMIVARCASCHGSHAILPAIDPLSPVNPANLVKTCGKCHTDAEAYAVKRVHLTYAEPQSTLIGYNAAVKSFYWGVVGFGVLVTLIFVVVVVATKREQSG